MKIKCERCKEVYEVNPFDYGLWCFNRRKRLIWICSCCTDNFDIIYEKNDDYYYNGK